MENVHVKWEEIQPFTLKRKLKKGNGRVSKEIWIKLSSIHQTKKQIEYWVYQ